MTKDDTKKRILARRARFLAIAVASAGLVQGCGGEADPEDPPPKDAGLETSPEACLTPPNDAGDDSPQPCLTPAEDASAEVCLAAPQDAGDDGPQPCLTPPADAGDANP